MFSLIVSFSKPAPHSPIGEPHVYSMYSKVRLYSFTSLFVNFYPYIMRGLNHSVQVTVFFANYAVIGQEPVLLDEATCVSFFDGI